VYQTDYAITVTLHLIIRSELAAEQPIECTVTVTPRPHLNRGDIVAIDPEQPSKAF